MPTQHVATLLGATCCVRSHWPPCCDVLRHVGSVVGSSLKPVKVAKHTQHVAPNNVAICCVGMLRSFSRGLLRIIICGYRETSPPGQFAPDNSPRSSNNYLPGAHHPDPPSPIQTLWDNLCAYLSIFRNCGVLRFAHNIFYTVRSPWYSTI